MPSHLLKSLIGPLIMLVAGVGFAAGAMMTLELGSLRRMGPGAFPLLVGGLLTGLALLGLLQTLRNPEPTFPPDLLGVFGVGTGVAAFALFTPLAGVLPATALAILATSTAIPQFRWRHRVLLAVSVAVAVWLIFVLGLGMPFVAVKGL